MAYGFNDDRSKTPVYTKAEIDGMELAQQADVEAMDAATNQRIDTTNGNLVTQKNRIDMLVNTGSPTVEGRDVLWTGSETTDDIALAESANDYDCLEVHYYIDSDAAINKRIERIPVTGGRLGALQASYTDASNSQVSGSSVALSVVAGTSISISGNAKAQVIESSGTIDMQGAASPLYITAVYGIKFVSATEVADIRVGANGIGYSLAGEAIRSQFNQLVDRTKNLIDLSTFIDGYYCNMQNGALEPSGSLCCSQPIAVSENTDYVVSSASSNNVLTEQLRIAFYDDTLTFISGIFGTVAFTTPANTAYMRISFSKTVTTPQLEQGSAATKIEPEPFYFKSNRVWTDDIGTNVVRKVNNSLENGSIAIDPIETTFFDLSANLVDPDSIVVGEYVNQITGTFNLNANYSRTGYIRIAGGEQYVIKNYTGYNAQVRIAYYNADKQFISGLFEYINDIGNPFTVPENAAFIAFSTSKGLFPFMLAKSDVDVSYTDFYAYVDSKYLPPDGGSAFDGDVFNVPADIYAYTGLECNVYFENLCTHWDKYDWDVGCSKGMQLERCYRFTPIDADAGTYTLTIVVSAGNETKTFTSQLHVIASTAGSGDTKSIIVLGDSTTDNMHVTPKILGDFENDAMTVACYGTRGTSPGYHEGRSGWSLQMYMERESVTYTDGRGTIYNPFYDPTSETFDASYYFANSGVSVPDWFFINMGINDMFSYYNDATLETAITENNARLTHIINSLKTAAPNMKIGLCLTIPPNHSQDAFGKSYKCNQTRNRYKRNNAMWVNNLIENYSNIQNVYIVPLFVALDTVYNMGMEQIQVNSRNTETYQSPIANGGVHPYETGYWQIADVYTAFLKYQASIE